MEYKLQQVFDWFSKQQRYVNEIEDWFNYQNNREAFISLIRSHYGVIFLNNSVVKSNIEKSEKAQDIADDAQVVGFPEEPYIRRPVPVYPLTGNDDVPLFTEFKASKYAPFYEVDERDFRQFQVKKPGDSWEDSIVDEEVDSDELVLQGELDIVTEYVWRCRDRTGGKYYSEWMEEQHFKTSDQYIEAPTILSPEEGEEEVSWLPMIELSEFSVMNHPDEYHTRTEVEIRRKSDSEVVYNHVTTTPIEAHEVTDELDIDTEHEVRARYEGNYLGWSEWSDWVEFKVWNQWVETPSITTPEDGAEDIIPFPEIKASDFIPENYPDTHKKSEWEIRKVEDSSLVKKVTSEQYRTSWSVGEQLPSDTHLKVRVRYKGEVIGWSSFSDWVEFTTATEYVLTPDLVSPEDGEEPVYSEPTLEASAFEIYEGGTDTHIESRWQLATDEDFNEIVYDTGWQSEDLTEYTLPEVIAETTTYYWRVRYKGETYGMSGWATPFSFKTADQLHHVVEPNVIHPDSEEDWEYLYIRGSQFEMNHGLAKHIKTKAEVRQGETVIWDWEKEDEFDPEWFDGEDQRDEICESDKFYRLEVDKKSYTYKIAVPSYILTLVEIAAPVSLEEGSTFELNGYTAKVLDVHGDHEVEIHFPGNSSISDEPSEEDVFEDDDGVTREIDSIERIKRVDAVNLYRRDEVGVNDSSNQARTVYNTDNEYIYISFYDHEFEPSEEDTYITDKDGYHYRVISKKIVQDEPLFLEPGDELSLSASDVIEKYKFSDDTERDNYFSDNSSEKVDGVFIKNDDQYQVWSEENEDWSNTSTLQKDIEVNNVFLYRLYISNNYGLNLLDSVIEDNAGFKRKIIEATDTSVSEDTTNKDWKQAYDSDDNAYLVEDKSLEIKYTFNFNRNPYLISYKITIPNSDNAEENAPNTWTIEGRNEGQPWTIIDQRNNIYDWTKGEDKVFYLNNTSGTGYKYYRIIVTENNGGASTEIKDLELHTHTEPNYLEWITGPDIEDSLDSSLQPDSTYEVRIGYAADNNPEEYFWSDWLEVTTVEE